MNRSGNIFTIIILSFFLFSCRTTRSLEGTATGVPDASAYVERYKDLAVSEMKRTGIPASITLAQGIIESDYGRSRLAREGNNHFGIKCHNDWKGPIIRHTDDRRNECFRKYSRPEDSFYDHSDFLRTGSRYASLFDLPSTDYKAWARGLKKAGYATNPDYANMLIRKIEENNLDYYDRGYTTMKKPEKQFTEAVPDSNTAGTNETAGNGSSLNDADNVTVSVASYGHRIMENNRIRYIIVKEGETLKSIEDEFQLLKWELTRYNEVDSDFTPVPGQILYLQPKRDRAEPGKETHIAGEGETMYHISQLYGVKLRKLYEYNRMNEGEEPSAGQKIWLRSMKTVM